MKSRLLLSGLVALGVALAGCSAGTPDASSSSTTGSGSTTTTTTGTITESLSSTTVSSAAPVTVTATARTSAGAAVSGVVVTFTTGSLGVLSSSTALTNSSGVASVTLSPASATATGADVVTASATVGSSAVTSSQGYQLSATTAAIASFTSNTGTSSTDKLAAYAQAVLTVNMSGVSAAAPATLTLSSSCVTAGKATISPTSVTNTTGTATFTYKDTGGCGSTLATDTVTATITGSGVTSSDQVYLTSPTANSITFTSASPSTIYLKGSGYTESSTVKFQVVDTDNNPLPGQQVTLSLSTFAGGLLMNQGTSAVTETSDANGYVSVIINSGTVPTPVRVLATLPSGVSTVSSVLSVATGLPTQLHFSLSQGTFNIEGANIDGTANTYTVRAADRSGNPVPDGTAILFWAEGGQIQASATTSTSNGISSATAQFQSQAYRPADGRVTVLAYAIGEESFIDKAGTNVYQLGDPFQDLGDLVKSAQFDNVYDSAHDETISISGAGGTTGTSDCAAATDTTTYPQFAIGATTANKPNSCDGTWNPRTYVRMAAETVFSTSGADPIWVSTSGLTSSCLAKNLYISSTHVDTTGPHAFYTLASNPYWYAGANSGAFTFLVSDENAIRLNPMAAGTIVSVSADATLITASVAGGSPIGSTLSATPASVSFKFAANVSVAVVTISFKSPSGLITSIPVTVYAATAPSSCS